MAKPQSQMRSWFRFPKSYSPGAGSKGFEPDINPHLGRCFRQPKRIALDRERSIPFTGTAALNGEGFDVASKDAMPNDLDVSNARKCQFALWINLKAELGIGEAIITVSSTKTGEPRFLPSPAPAKEGLKSQIDAHRDILQHLGMDLVQRGAFLFQHRVGSLLSIAR